MPILHVSMMAGKPAAYRQAILDSLYQALRSELNVPEGDEFMTITEHDPANFRYGNAFGIERSSDLVYIAVTLFDTRNIDHKQALFRRIAALLIESPGIRPEDIFINIYGTPKENWSVGLGEMQFGPDKTSHG